MASDPRIRASDDDRERAVALLREHHAAGRLTVEEFNERLDKAYAAKTLGDLDELMSDLPAIDLYRLPDASLPPHYRRQIPGHGFLHGGGRGRRHRQAARQVLAGLDRRLGQLVHRHHGLLRDLGAERRPGTSGRCGSPGRGAPSCSAAGSAAATRAAARAARAARAAARYVAGPIRSAGTPQTGSRGNIPRPGLVYPSRTEMSGPRVRIGGRGRVDSAAARELLSHPRRECAARR